MSNEVLSINEIAAMPKLGRKRSTRRQKLATWRPSKYTGGCALGGLNWMDESCAAAQPRSRAAAWRVVEAGANDCV